MLKKYSHSCDNYLDKQRDLRPYYIFGFFRYGTQLLVFPSFDLKKGNFITTYTNYKAGIKRTAQIATILAIVPLYIISCAADASRKQPSLFDTNSSLLSKKYTHAEISSLEQNFTNNPQQYSQQYGNLLIWQIHQKWADFALELGRVNELKDNIDAKEAPGLKRIYEGLKKTNIKMLKANDQHLLNIMMEKGTESMRDFFLFAMNDGKGSLLEQYRKDVTQRKDALLENIAQFNPRLSDELKYVPVVKNGREFSVLEALEDILNLKQIATPQNLTNLSDYFRVGIPGSREFCTPLYALVALAEKGEFSKENNPLNYNWLEIVKKASNDMKGWNHLTAQEMKKILNHPVYANLWVKKNLTYNLNYFKEFMDFEDIFDKKAGVCVHYSYAVTEPSRASGWKNVKDFWVMFEQSRGPSPIGLVVSTIKLTSKNIRNDIIYGLTNFDYKKIKERLDRTGKPLYWILMDNNDFRIRGPYHDLPKLANDLSYEWAQGNWIFYRFRTDGSPMSRPIDNNNIYNPKNR